MWTDIDINLTKQNDGDVKKCEDIEAVKNSIINIILTMQGERRMMPEFATNTYDLLFDPVDETTADSLGHNLVDAIELWDTRININNLHIVADADNHKYNIYLTFNIKGKNPNEIQQVFTEIGGL